MALLEKFKSFTSIAKQKLKLWAELAKQIKEERKALKQLPEAVERAVERGIEKAERKEKEKFSGETGIYLGACFSLIVSVLFLYVFVVYFDVISKFFLLLTVLIFSLFSQEILLKATLIVYSIFSFFPSHLLVTLLIFLGLFYLLRVLGIYQRGRKEVIGSIVLIIIFSLLLLFHPLLKSLINNFLDNQLSKYVEKFKNSEFANTFNLILHPEEAIKYYRQENV